MLKLSPVLLRILTVFVSGGVAAVSADGSLPSAAHAGFALAGVLLGALLPQLFASPRGPNDAA